MFYLTVVNEIPCVFIQLLRLFCINLYKFCLFFYIVFFVFFFSLKTRIYAQKSMFYFIKREILIVLYIFDAYKFNTECFINFLLLFDKHLSQLH